MADVNREAATAGRGVRALGRIGAAPEPLHHPRGPVRSPVPVARPVESIKPATKQHVPLGEDLAGLRYVDVPMARWALWIFLALLIFEGALRKWMFPGLATPLLLVRDPVLLAIYGLAIMSHAFPSHPLAFASQTFGLLALLASTLAEQFIPVVAIYGWRSNYLFLPLIFVMPGILNRGHVEQMGRALLLISIPMTFLLVRQFQAPADAPINIGVGGSEGYKTAMERVRTSGTFSFSNGTVAFLGLCTAFACHGIMERTSNRRLALVAVPFLMVSLAVCGSRSALLVVGQIVVGLLCFGFLRARAHFAVVRVALLLAGIGGAMSLVPVVREGLTVHQARFEASAENEDAVERIRSWFMVDPAILEDSPVFGRGLGLGTNVGAVYVSGDRNFLLGENEWGRVVAESGVLFGAGFILLRLAIVAAVLLVAIKAFRAGNSLPALLFSASWMQVAIGQFSQPTALGFAVFTAGLALAAAQERGVAERQAPG